MKLEHEKEIEYYMSYIIEKIGCFILIFILFLAGCGSVNNNQTEETASDNYVYLPEYQFIYTNGYNPYKSIIGEDGTLYFAGYKQGNGTQLFTLELGKKETNEISLGIDENMWVSSMGKDLKGNLIFAYSEYDDTLKQLVIVNASGDGKVQKTIDATKVFSDIIDFEVKNILGDENGNYYIVSGKSIFVIDDDGGLLFEIKTDYEIGDMFFTKDGEIIVANFNKGELEKVDKDKKKLKPMKNKISLGYGIYQAGRDKDIMYSQGNILYTCDLEDEEPTEVLNWMDSNINSLELGNYNVLEDGRIAAFSTPQASIHGESEWILLKKTERSQIPEKTILTYGHAFYNSTTSAQILRFNKLSKEYRIEMKQYGDDKTDLEAKRKLIQTDMITGEGPDIIDIGLLFSPDEHYEFIEMDILEDLNPYLENDEQISRENFLEQVLSVYEKENKLYAVMPSFMVKFLIGKESIIGNESSWTMEEMMTFISDQPKDAKVINTSRSDILNLLLKLNVEEFVDKETGECHFNGKEFQQLLVFASLFPKETEKLYYLTENMEQLRNDRILLLETGIISMTDFQVLSFLSDEPINCIGYPTNTGKGTTAVPCVSVIAMSKGSKHKEGAWEFIRFLLAKEQQIELGTSGMQGFPINKSALEHTFDKAMQAEYYEDEDGITREKSMQQHPITDELTVHFYAATKEEVARARELLDSIGNCMDNSTEKNLLAIVIEEAEAFFEGQKEVDEVAEIIQGRVQIYIDEK